MADGVLLLEKSKVADIRMRIFNADGTEADMCGNGARCAAYYVNRQSPVASRQFKIKIETKAGIIEAEVVKAKDNVRIKLTPPYGYKENIMLKINGRYLKVDFINTGVPHAIVFVEAVELLDVEGIGRAIRKHRKFAPCGVNVNFMEVAKEGSIKVRTYERGVEGETLACGTGSVASAIVFALSENYRQPPVTRHQQKINVETQGGEVLKVYFDRMGKRIDNVWLEGKVRMVFKGEFLAES